MDIRKLDLNLLLLLDKMHQTRNLSEAARLLGIRQPVASGKLAELRDFFDDQLFVRTGRGMRPTPLMESIVGPLREALTTLERGVLSKPRFGPEVSERTFTVTTSDIGVLIIIPPLIKMLQRLAPRASLRCVSIAHDRLDAALESGEVDMAIGYFPDLTGSGILRQGLFEHPFVCIARRDHPTIGDTITLDQFLRAEHLVVNQEGRSQELVERHLAALGHDRRIPLHLAHFMSVPQVIAVSDMISIVPWSLGAWYVEISNIKLVRPPIDLPLIELKQFWHRRVNDDPAVSWFRHQAAEQLIRRNPNNAMSPDYASVRLSPTHPPFST